MKHVGFESWGEKILQKILKILAARRVKLG